MLLAFKMDRVKYVHIYSIYDFSYEELQFFVTNAKNSERADVLICCILSC